MKNFYLNIELMSKNAKIPTRGTKGSAGLDFYTPVSFTIPPRGDSLVPLGIRVEFPEGYVLIMKEKSGLAVKKKIHIGACVIDSDYRGEPHVHLFNNSDQIVSFKKGEKVCQGIITYVWTGTPILKECIKINTGRGEDGFGSTGE
jgi:dUTP pyrophosphatase